ncbi:PTS glucose transporter subunit IIA [Neobacillus cucumis]|uniref:PTS sugar transporter subunit IIA n=1 Tax=Neobacillus cucumis TaxID=1740721 RepID=UPI002E1D8D42|nr:PTS glucose transporter subunit IIA [Neobacillus cucumis]
MFKLFQKKSKNVDIYAPVTGGMMNLENVPDKVFGSKMVGDGVAFELEDDLVCAPCDGTISFIAETLHAVGITAENGAEILIHIGLDTVNLNGQGFQKLVDQGAKVKKGTPILRVDRGYLKEKNIILTTPMVITNSAEYDLNVLENNEVVSGETLVISCSKK